jgi:hypothetical protein
MIFSVSVRAGPWPTTFSENLLPFQVLDSFHGPAGGDGADQRDAGAGDRLAETPGAL